MERAIAYIRVSSGRQVEGNSLASQEKRVWEYVASRSYELDRIFVGKGESAKTEARPELQEMLAYAKSKRGSLDVLIFPKVDRFARYTEDYFHLKRSFRALGIRVESADERFDDSPSGRFMESLLAATAQFDNDVRSERCKGGMKEAVAQGRWVWAAPRGYRNIRFNGKATIEPDPVAGPRIQRAFLMLASGKFRACDVRKWLASQGISLGRSQFYRMVRSKSYIGVIEAFGLIERGLPPYVPLVSERVFYGAQEAIARRRQLKSYQRDNPDFPLRGTVLCPSGHLLTAGWSTGRSSRYAYYRCKKCRYVNLPREALEEQFAARLRQEMDFYILSPSKKEELISAWHESAKDRQARSESAAKSIERLTELQRSLAMKCAEGVLPDSLARDQISELGRKIAELRASQSSDEVENTPIEEVLDFAEEFLTNLDSYWISADIETKKHIQSFFCPTGATVLFKLQSRTGSKPASTGLSLTTTPKESHLVGHTHGSPNTCRERTDVTIKDALAYYQRVWKRFYAPQ